MKKTIKQVLFEEDGNGQKTTSETTRTTTQPSNMVDNAPLSGTTGGPSRIVNGGMQNISSTYSNVGATPSVRAPAPVLVSSNNSNFDSLSATNNPPIGLSNSSSSVGNEVYSTPMITPSVSESLSPTVTIQEFRERVEKPVIVHEKIIPEEVREVQPVIHREIERSHVIHTTQPLYDYKTGPLQTRDYIMPLQNIAEYTGSISREHEENLSREFAGLNASTRVVYKAPIIIESIKPVTIEEYRPIIRRQVVHPNVNRAYIPSEDRVALNNYIQLGSRLGVANMGMTRNIDVNMYQSRGIAYMSSQYNASYGQSYAGQRNYPYGVTTSPFMQQNSYNPSYGQYYGQPNTFPYSPYGPSYGRSYGQSSGTPYAPYSPYEQSYALYSPYEYSPYGQSYGRSYGPSYGQSYMPSNGSRSINNQFGNQYQNYDNNPFRRSHSGHNLKRRHSVL